MRVPAIGEPAPRPPPPPTSSVDGVQVNGAGPRMRSETPVVGESAGAWRHSGDVCKSARQ